jgi:hypothetical protein
MPCPPRQREPQTRVPRAGPRLAAPVDPSGQVVMLRRSASAYSRKFCDRHTPGAGIAWPEGALVTSKRSGVVTRAAIPLTARACDWISRLQRDYVFLYCRPRSILTVATACTVAIERTRTL